MFYRPEYYLLAAPIWVIAAAVVPIWPRWICLAFAVAMVVIVSVHEWRIFWDDNPDSEGSDGT